MKCEFFKNGIDIEEMLLALFSDGYSIGEKRNIWEDWRTKYYNLDYVIDFFKDSLFSMDNRNYLNVLCDTENYKNFYEIAMSLDMENFDSRAYYLFWILSYGQNETYTQIVKDAYEYDCDTIKSMFPYIEKVLFDEPH